MCPRAIAGMLIRAMTRSQAVLRRAIVLAALMSCLLGPEVATAQNPGDAARYFRTEVSPEAVPRGGWAVEGYVYSTHSYRVGTMRLRAEVLDASGQVLGESYGWVAGNIPAGGRGYFVVPVPQRGAVYRVSVVSFFLISLDAP